MENTNENIETFIQLQNKKMPYSLLSLRKRLDLVKFNFDSMPISPELIISIDGNTISTPGNLTIISGASKAGKTGAITSILACAISSQKLENEILDVKENEKKEAVLHFDTEQSKADHDKAIRRVLKKAQLDNKPEYFDSFLIRDFNPKEKINAIEILCEEYMNMHNGIFIIVIDGVADLIASVNDEKASNEMIDILNKIASKYNCPVIGVLHLNPKSDKMRGHYGSQFERKSESILKITKKDGGISVLEGVFLRNSGAIPMIQFIYDKELEAHVKIGVVKQLSLAEKKKNGLILLTGKLFKTGDEKFTIKELIDKIMIYENIRERAANNRFRSLKLSRLIIKDENGYLIRAEKEK